MATFTGNRNRRLRHMSYQCRDTRRRVLLLVGGVVGAIVCATACSAAASAAVIPGDPLQIFGDGSGRLQVRFQGETAGELRPSYLDLADGRSGMAITVYGNNVATICGTGFGGSSTPVSAPSVTGSGTTLSPYQMSTSYICNNNGINLNVTQTFIYINGDTDFIARYAFTNPGTAAVRFSAVCRGVFTMGESGLGQGFLDASSPRTLGAFNDAEGSEGGFVELASSPWTRYLAGALPTGSPYEPGESAIFGGLPNTVDSALVLDPRAAVQFDRYTSFGLEPGATDSYEVDWFFGRYDGLSLSPQSGSLGAGNTRAVTVSSHNHGQPVSGATIHYDIAGANPASGSVSTAGDGSATIEWIGRHAGQDTLSAHVDGDGNGILDPATEVQQVGTFTWSALATPTTPSASPPPAPPPPPSVPASNQFSVIKAVSRADGAIKLTLSARTAGRYLAVATSRRSSARYFAYGRTRGQTRRAGRVTLTIRPTKAAKRRIMTARLKVAIRITFTPTSGTARTKRVSVIVKAAPRAATS